MDRDEVLFWSLISIIGTWALVLVELAIAKDLGSAYGQFVLGGTTLIGVVLGCVVGLGYLLWPPHGPKQERLSLLRKVFQEWLSANLWKGELRIGISIPTDLPAGEEGSIPVYKLKHFDRALTYLKDEQGEIHEDWIETNEHIVRYNDLAPRRQEFLKELLRTEMKVAYPTLTESTPSVQNNYYHLPLLILAFESHSYPCEDEWQVRLYKYEHQREDGRPSTLKCNSQTLISSDDVSDVQLEKLDRTLDEIMRNPQLIQMNNELSGHELAAEERLKDFHAKLRKLCDKIDFQEV